MSSPSPLWCSSIVAIFATFVLNFTRFGRYACYAVGGNPSAQPGYSGVDTVTTRDQVAGSTSITGLRLAGIAAHGVVTPAQFNFGSGQRRAAGYGAGPSIAAVVIGGC